MTGLSGWHYLLLGRFAGDRLGYLHQGPSVVDPLHQHWSRHAVDNRVSRISALEADHEMSSVLECLLRVIRKAKSEHRSRFIAPVSSVPN
jgi:hypothetical protein